MRAVLHVLATLVLVPYLVLAVGFVVLGHSIAQGSLWAFVDTLMAHALWIVPWGIVGFSCAMILVALLGLIPRVRWLGGLFLCLFAAASLLVIIFGSTSRIGAPEMLFLLPCALVLVFGACLALVARQNGSARA